MKKRTTFNPKRSICKNDDGLDLVALSEAVRYSGNPEHKRNPGDFRLTPPSQPRADKTLCDAVKIFTKAEATALLREGVRKGLISERMVNHLPQNIWSVTKDGYPIEAQLENPEQGTYHGYPMPESDPFRAEVLARWKKETQ